MSLDETSEAAPSGWQADPLPPATLFALAVVVGMLGGIGAVLFRSAIALFQELAFYGELGFHFQPEIHLAPSAWGWGVILVPVVGALIVSEINDRLGPEHRGHGVPEVMEAIYYRRGCMRPGVALAKALASAISIGSGGSVGREGPIIQIGSAFGSALGQIWHMPAHQRILLVSAGAAAGIAATFNAPLAGVAFAMELLLVSVSAQNVALVAAAVVTGTYVGRLYGGIEPVFGLAEFDLFSGQLVGTYQLLLCIPLGVLTGGAAAVFVRAIYWFEDRLEALIGNPYVRHMAGMLVVGCMIYAFMVFTGEYYVAGVGYATIADVLADILTSPLFLLLLFAGKLLATSLTLGSGASGGVFSPALFLGATLGAAYADAFDALVPGLAIEPLLFAIAGMAGMIGATTSAVVTAIVMVFEQTRDYSAILPIIIVVGLAYVVRVRLTAESVYTLKLARRGHDIPQGLQSAMTTSLDARQVMNREFRVVQRRELERHLRRRGLQDRYTIIADGETLVGLARDDLIERVAREPLEGLVSSDFVVVSPATGWAELMRAIKRADSELVIVARGAGPDDIAGVITRREIARAARDSAELMD